MTTGERIKQKRESLGISQERLAELTGYKGKSSISKLESAGDKVTLKSVSRIATALNCEPNELLGWNDSGEIQPAEWRRFRRIADYTRDFTDAEIEIIKQIAYLAEDTRDSIIHQINYEYEKEKRKREAVSAS